MKKKSDIELFKELRMTNIVIGTLLVLSVIAAFFLMDTSIIILLSFTLGIMLILSGLQKYFQENPKVRNAVVFTLMISIIALIIWGIYLYINIY